ncbi:MAG: hypothetical protein IJT05_02610 [Lachnospiraceae bacterium]|nr:hypothetical protein [Lachnospiraceae bacterium]
MEFHIAPVSYLTIYLDVTAVIICVGILILGAKSINGRDKTEEQLFRSMLISLILNGITNAASYACHYQNLGLPAPVRMLAPTIAELTVLYVGFTWMLYVDYKLYGSRDRIFRTYRYFQIPVFLFTGLSFINLFTGFLFAVDENMLFIWKPGYYLLLVAQYFYLLFPVFLLIRHALTHKRIQFFHIWPTVAPGVLSALFTQFTIYSARCLGLTIAVVFLYFSYVERWRFNDRESGFFNRHYVDYLMELKEDQIPDYQSAVLIYAEHVNKELFSILESNMPYGGELIRLSDRLFLLFSESGNASSIKLLSAAFREEAEEYEKNNPEKPPIQMVVSYTMRSKEKSVKEFMLLAAAE